MLRVIVESPYAGPNEKVILMNEYYGEYCMNDCLVKHNESPYASHLLYTRRHVLRDSDPEERKLGIEAGFFWRDVADKTVFYVDLGVTDGMKLGIQDCKEKGKPYEIRRLPEYKWRQFTHACMHDGVGYPPIRSMEYEKEFKEEIEEEWGIEV